MKRLITKIKIIKSDIMANIDSCTKRKKISIDKKKKQAFVMLAANYNNLGDVAITYSQVSFLKKNLPEDYEVIEIDVEDTYKVYKEMKKIVDKNTIITLIGGGNNGNLYKFIESKRRFILKKFKNNKIISFPQTILYENSKEGQTYKKEFVKICNKCKNLTIIAREEKSYSEYKKILNKINVLLVPDIVFSEEFVKQENREGAMIIFRRDKEKSINNKIEEEVIKELEKRGIEYVFNDTCDIDLNENKNQILLEYINNLRKKKIVITDRLHGMILSYITNTPCLVFTNNNHKIESTYNSWMQNQNFIKLYSADAIDSIKRNMDFIMEIKEIKKENLLNEFENILTELRRM